MRRATKRETRLRWAAGRTEETKKGQEIVYGLRALALLTALIYGVLQYHSNRTAVRAGDEVVEARYKNDDV